MRKRLSGSPLRRKAMFEDLESRRLLAVTPITLGDFSSPDVLDFESVSTGPISGTDSVFTDFGISELQGSGSNSGDTYNSRPNSSRALWSSGSGLRVVDPGTSGLGLSNIYTIEFAQEHERVGFGVHDQAGNYQVQFLNGGNVVETYTFNSATGADLDQRYLESDSSFDTIRIDYVSGSGGFGIDNITIEGNEAPIAEDDSYSVDEDSTLTVAAPGVLANDTDADGDTLSASIATLPSNGTVSLNPDGSFEYIPAPDFHGTDSFTYVVDDGNGGSDLGEVTITVNSVIDALIDVKPGNGDDVDPINLSSEGRTPMAILSSQTANGDPDDFTAGDLDLDSVDFLINGVSIEADKLTLEDVDGDGDLDLLIHFLTEDLADILTTEDTELTLSAEFGGAALGVDLSGSDTVKVKKSNGGKKK